MSGFQFPQTGASDEEEFDFEDEDEDLGTFDEDEGLGTFDEDEEGEEFDLEGEGGGSEYGSPPITQSFQGLTFLGVGATPAPNMNQPTPTLNMAQAPTLNIMQPPTLNMNQFQQQPMYGQPQQYVQQPSYGQVQPIPSIQQPKIPGLGPIAPGVVPNLPGLIPGQQGSVTAQQTPFQIIPGITQPLQNYSSLANVPPGTTLGLTINPLGGVNQWQERNQAQRTAFTQVTTPLTSLMAGPPQMQFNTQVPNISLAGSGTFGVQNLNPSAVYLPQQTPGPMVVNTAPVPPPQKGTRGKKNPVVPTVSLPSQTTGLPLLQPSSIPYDPTRQEPGEGSVEYQRRVGLYQALLNQRLPNGQFVDSHYADVLSRMRNNVDVLGVGYNQAAMQILNQFLPVNK
jgi:hypothetical protein